MELPRVIEPLACSIASSPRGGKGNEIVRTSYGGRVSIRGLNQRTPIRSGDPGAPGLLRGRVLPERRLRLVSARNYLYADARITEPQFGLRVPWLVKVDFQGPCDGFSKSNLLTEEQNI